MYIRTFQDIIKMNGSSAIALRNDLTRTRRLKIIKKSRKETKNCISAGGSLIIRAATSDADDDVNGSGVKLRRAARSPLYITRP